MIDIQATDGERRGWKPSEPETEDGEMGGSTAREMYSNAYLSGVAASKGSRLVCTVQ